MMGYTKQADLDKPRKPVCAIIVEVLGQIHESEHHDNQVNGKNHLRFVKHIVVQDEDDHERNKHEELRVEQFQQ